MNNYSFLLGWICATTALVIAMKLAEPLAWQVVAIAVATYIVGKTFDVFIQLKVGGGK